MADKRQSKDKPKQAPPPKQKPKNQNEEHAPDNNDPWAQYENKDES
jgi:hypothetical protein